MHINFRRADIFDSRNSSEIYSGICDFAMFDTPNGRACLHTDIPAAKKTIARLRTMESELGVHIAFAHVTQWMKDGKDKVLMSLLDNHLTVAAKELIPYDKTV